jgi:hypothetical protein
MRGSFLRDAQLVQDVQQHFTVIPTAPPKVVQMAKSVDSPEFRSLAQLAGR